MNVLTEIGGRYAAFVVPAYGVSLIGLIALAIEAIVRGRRWKKRAEDETDD